MEDSEEGGERYLIVWDMHGLERAVNLDGCVSKRVQAALREENHTVENPWQMVEKSLLRARFNSQRNYEIYAIILPEGTTEDEVQQWFKDQPQQMANLIRKKGIKLHGDQGVKPVIF